MPLILPDFVAQNLARDQMVDQTIALARHWTRILREKDPRLSIVLARERISDPRLAPNRWHVKLDLSDEGLPDSYMPILGPRGCYREPDIGVLEELGRRDMWRSENGVEAQMRAHAQRDEEAAHRGRERAGEIREDIHYTMKGQDEPSILFGDGQWTKSAKGKRG